MCVGALATRRPARRIARGFTLVEVLVTITLIAIVIAILFPALGRARQYAREASCKSNLRQFYIGLTQYADTHETMCSGAMDWRRDGCFTEVGWVADLVNQGIPVGELLCPASPYQLHVEYGRMLSFDAAGNQCADSLGTEESPLPDGSVLKNACRQLHAAAGLEDKLDIMKTLVLEKGYNTNYAASWFLVRGEVLIDNASGALVNTRPACATSVAERSCTEGGLHRARLGNTPVPGHHIPLIGCANAANQDELVFGHELGPYHPETLLADSYTRGPVDRATMQAPEITGSGAGPSRWYGPWNDTLQDYRGFGPVHGQKNGVCNLLFLDGSVRGVKDVDGDGLLNNGFEPSPDNGFATATLELPPEEYFSGWSLNKGRVRQ